MCIRDRIEGYDVYIWKKHIEKAKKNVVDVSLKPSVE